MSADTPLDVTPSLTLPAAELSYRVCRASGPGGQHVNTSNTKVQLLWSPLTSAALSDEQRALVLERLRGRISREGQITCSSDAHRSQARNIDEARAQLSALLARALHVQKVRKETAPSRAQRAKRLRAKRERGEVKASRREGPSGWD
ncbi:MAG: aminoacyl-tRNA hydrolase [Deltaproteobacteria bacterium]|nr:aminoacyl-tRNA hydrolase [Deltaproteobacteria bacterium]